MSLTVATGQPKRFVLLQGGEVVYAGELGATDCLATTLEVVASESENEFLGLLALTAATFPALPASGWLEVGDIYAYDDSLVMVRQSHNRTEHNPADVLALFVVYREDAADVLEWVTGESVQVGTQRMYEDVTYECIQAHVTQGDWTPPTVPALWRVVVETPTTDEWAVGVAYSVGDEVTYLGQLYRCRQAHTSISTWTPAAVLALWLPI